MQGQFKRRFPTYLAGLLLGLAVLVVTTQLKRAFAPRFIDSGEKRLPVSLIAGGSLRYGYPEDPGLYLIPGYPSQMALGFERAPGKYEAVSNFGYRELTEKSMLIGPLRESGNYELRATLYICERPGEAVCTKREFIQPVRVVTEGAAPSEAPVSVDLRAIVKDVVAQDAAANPPPAKNSP